jgi:CrcB protein
VDTFLRYLAVAGGGAAGAVLRYVINLSGLSKTAQPFPAATFVINVTGCFVIGFFLTLAEERIPVNPHLRLAIAVGFVGAYTTFSTFEYEAVRLVDSGKLPYAAAYVLLSLVLGYGAVLGGMFCARRIERAPGGAFQTSSISAGSRAVIGHEPDLSDESIDVDPVAIKDPHNRGAVPSDPDKRIS